MNNHLPEMYGEFQDHHPLRLWYCVAAVVILLFAVVAPKYVVLAVTTDKTHLCAFILLLFVVTFIKSYLDIVFVDEEMQTATTQVQDIFKIKSISKFISKAKTSLFREHVKNLQRIYRRDTQIDQSALITLMQSKMYSKIKFVDTLSAVLVTLGLIGTVIGLLISVGGIGAAVDSVGASGGDLASGVKTTLSGMGTAFYTTLLGAMLGGVILRVLNGIVEDQMNHLVIHIAELTEIYILPVFRRHARRRQGKEDKNLEDTKTPTPFEVIEELEAMENMKEENKVDWDAIAGEVKDDMEVEKRINNFKVSLGGAQ